MTAAIFGLLGVLVGGILNGVVSLALDGVRARRAARGSALLVMEQLIPTIAALRMTGEMPVWGMLMQPGVGRRDAWDEHKATLQVVLSPEEWQVLGVTFGQLDHAVEERDLVTNGEPISDGQANGLSRTFLLASMSLAYLGAITHMPSRRHPIKRRKFVETNTADAKRLAAQEMELRREAGDLVSPIGTPAAAGAEPGIADF
ncbi:MAG: hypothetical protein QOJ29_1864 [Thermoleophilaceae bacterium]|jgi:hypothetical protein|nr:hypothetical protein [Thermoleophilaceae bacterium]